MSGERRALVITLAAVAVLALGVLWLRPAARWYSCQGGDGYRALVRGATMGSPSDLECVAVALDSEPRDEPITDEPAIDYVPRRRRPPHSIQRSSPSKNASRPSVNVPRKNGRLGSMPGAAYDAEQLAWDDAYNAWLDETDGGQDDHDA